MIEMQHDSKSLLFNSFSLFKQLANIANLLAGREQNEDVSCSSLRQKYTDNID